MTKTNYDYSLWEFARDEFEEIIDVRNMIDRYGRKNLYLALAWILVETSWRMEPDHTSQFSEWYGSESLWYEIMNKATNPDACLDTWKRYQFEDDEEGS